MVTTIPKSGREIRPKGMGPGPGNDGSGRNGPDGSGGSPQPSADRYRLGMWFALAAIMMLFIAFTSAYIIRQGMSDDWRPLQMPPVLWLTTAMLIGSSITLEIARRMMKRDWVQASSRWLSLTAMLGTAFLIGQLLAWRQLRASGIYMNSNPHSSFFYVLTGAHGLHLFGGVIALYYITLRAWRESKLEGHEVTLAYANGRIVRLTSLAVDLTAVYWHFMDGLWIYLFVLLFVW